jgi:hypothetical protein
MHRDIIFYEGANHVIEVDNEAYAQYDTVSTSAEIYSNESKREWDLSTGFEMSVGGGGHSVSASLENTYGENFSNASTQITEMEISEITKADLTDQVIYNGTNYAIWEYPVYGAEADDPEQVQTISVIWPLTGNQTNSPTTRKSTWCDENFYAPGHQLYNVWSYDHTALGVGGFDDLAENIKSKSTTGGTDIAIRMSENSTATRSSGFHNQISAGLEYSYENELNIPFVGNVFDFSFRAYANGSYAHESLSTFSTEVTDETGITVSYPSADDLPNTNIYLYWAKAGYLVADYQTEPDNGGIWLRYEDPDPAFILPWYGFPDPTAPVAPLCGPDKQLFTHDIELDPTYVQNGDTVTMTATVRNFSAQSLSDVDVRFYLGEPAADNDIGDCNIATLDRINGPQQCNVTWEVAGGSGEEKIYAVIDPDEYITEMHDEGDLINNNIGYRLLYVANADTFDPGLRLEQTYQSILYEDSSGLGFGLYLPTTNITETFRYELIPTDLGEMRIVGDPIQVLAFSGGESEPDQHHTFSPTPAGMMAFYRDEDLLPGMDEADLKLYHLGSSGWEEATCPGYDLVRFPDDYRLAVPICQTGTFVLTDQQPENKIYLPLVMQ